MSTGLIEKNSNQINRKKPVAYRKPVFLQKKWSWTATFDLILTKCSEMDPYIDAAFDTLFKRT